MAGKKFGPTEWRKGKPIRVQTNVGEKKPREWVCVGGPIEITPAPPKTPYTIREATSEEYEQLMKRGVQGIEEVGKSGSTTNTESGNA